MANDITNTSFAEEWLNQAEWRRGKAEEYPDDARANTDAAELWEKLAAAASERDGISKLVLHTYSALADNEDNAFLLGEAQSRAYTEVGFHRFPDTPDDLLTRIITDAGFKIPQLVAPTPRGTSKH